MEDLSEKYHVNFYTLTNELMHVEETKETINGDYASWALSDLVDHIIRKHHHYIRESHLILESYLEKVVKVHGKHHEVLYKISELYNEVADELLLHMVKEENILFPYIKQLDTAYKSHSTSPHARFGTVNNPIRMMMAEHDSTGNILKEIGSLTHQYEIPEWACNTFKALYAKLDEYEQDLLVHVHLENDILFPKTIEMENEMNKQIL